MRAIIDIGDQKTGSKSRQSFIALNRDNLVRHGYCSLKSTKIRTSDTGLHAYADATKSRKYFSELKNVPNDNKFEERFEKAMTEEMDKVGSSNFIFSFEGLMGLNYDGVSKLARMMDRHFSEVIIVAFLRRQDRKAVSAYTTRLRVWGAKDKNVLYHPNGLPRGRDYYKVLNTWQSVFSKDSIFFIDYDGFDDVVREFAKLAALPAGFEFPEQRKNTSMSALGAEVLRRFNKDLAHTSKYKSMAPRIRSVIRSYYLGTPMKPPRHEAEKLFYEYASSNERLAQVLGSEKRYFFDEDFSDYPEQAEPIELTLSEVEGCVEKALSAASR